MTQKDAIQKFNSGWWTGKTPEEIVAFQLYEERLCMPFEEFHKAVGAALGRPVWTHEFAMPAVLKKEFESRRAA